jgi:hypothetical protein
MSGVKIQGVDSIKFDDQDDDGRLSNLSLGKDVRKLSVKYAFFFQTVMPLIICLTFLLIALVVPHFTLIFMPLSAFFAYIWSRKRKRFIAHQKGLFDEPKYLNYTKKAAEIDFAPKELSKEVKAASPGVGKGVFFLGHEVTTGQEIHAEDGKFRTHIIIFGTTGSGKTENILSLCVNFLVQASGFILVDGKGDTLLFAKCFSLCRAFGRTDDLYLLNFMDEGISSDLKRVEKITNTFNFLVDATAPEANAIIGGLLPNDSNGGSGMWEGRAATGISSLNKAIFYLKDNGFIDVDPDTYRAYFGLEEFVALAMNEAIPKDKRGGLWSILKSINYKPPSDGDPNPKQNSATEEQFQYITMQYTESFNMLAEEYAHITVSQVPDISITDIVLRRRILLVLLPSLAKSEQSVRNLGRIVIAMTRNVSSKAIGSNIEGDIATTIESKPTAAVSSFGLIFDEFGAYATKGASTLPAQVRSLNMVCIFAGQDYEAFKKGDEIEAATIFANCTIKLCMKLECALTFAKFNESAGEKYIMVQENYETKDTMFGRKFVPGESARVEKRPVLDLKDLKEQSNGLETLIYGSMVHRLAAFYADPIMTPKSRLNHFVEIRRPSFSDVESMRNGVDGIYRRLKKRLEQDWESEESTIKNIIMSFSSFPDECLKTFGQVDGHVKDNQSSAPTETELAIFALATFSKRIEIVDHNVSKSLKYSIGVDTDEDFDDDELLGEDGADMIGFSPNTSFINDNVLNVDTTEIPVQVVRQHDVEDELVDTGIFSPKERSGNIAMDLLGKMDKLIKAKRLRLDKAEVDSFDSLKAINLDAFDTQQGLQSLEELLLKKEGSSNADAIKLANLASRNMVVEMGLSTNVAIVSGDEKKKKSPSRSSKEVKGLINRLVTKA